MKRSLLLCLFAVALACSSAFAQPSGTTPAIRADVVANGPVCAAEAPFYWEIGAAGGALARGSVDKGRRTVTRDTTMSIASASKWAYGAYVNEVRGGALSADDTKFLTFRSGYSAFDKCTSGQTVAQCAVGATFVRRSENKFAYSGGHMQKHAATFMPGMGTMKASTFASTIDNKLGTTFGYSSPQPAGGIVTSAGAYATFLQRVMSDKLVDGKFLAADAVPTTGAQATKSPVPEAWRYGRGHWIELDGTYSSPGAFGFYPWISADKKYYGVIARQGSAASTDKPAWSSVLCGRAIRDAFVKF